MCAKWIRLDSTEHGRSRGQHYAITCRVPRWAFDFLESRQSTDKACYLPERLPVSEGPRSMLPSASFGRRARPGTLQQQLQALRGCSAHRRRPVPPRVAAAPRADGDVYADVGAALRAMDIEYSRFGTVEISTFDQVFIAKERAAAHGKKFYAEANAAWGALEAEEAARGIAGVSPATFNRFKVAQQHVRAHKQAYNEQLRQARLAASLPPAPAHAPPPSPPVALPPTDACITPPVPRPRTAAANAWAAAAVAFASMAAGHEAAAEAAEAAAANQPAWVQSGAAEWWVRAAYAWRWAIDALEEARRDDPQGPAVREAEAAVQAAQRFRAQRRWVCD